MFQTCEFSRQRNWTRLSRINWIFFLIPISLKYLSAFDSVHDTYFAVTTESAKYSSLVVDLNFCSRVVSQIDILSSAATAFSLIWGPYDPTHFSDHERTFFVRNLNCNKKWLVSASNKNIKVVARRIHHIFPRTKSISTTRRIFRFIDLKNCFSVGIRRPFNHSPH